MYRNYLYLSESVTVIFLFPEETFFTLKQHCPDTKTNVVIHIALIIPFLYMDIEKYKNQERTMILSMFWHNNHIKRKMTNG